MALKGVVKAGIAVESEKVGAQILFENAGHAVVAVLAGAVFDGEDDGVEVSEFAAVMAYLSDHLLETHLFVQVHSIQSVSYDQLFPRIMHVDLQALQPVRKIFQVALYLGIAGELVAGEVGVVGGVAEIMVEREVGV